MNEIFYAFAILLFAAVVLCIEGVYQWWNNYHGPEAKRVDARIRALSAGGHIGTEQLSILKKRLLSESPQFQRWLMSLPRVSTIDRWLEQSGSAWSVAQLLGYTILTGAGVLAVGALLPVPFGIVTACALLMSALPVLHIASQRRKRLKKLEAQLPDAVDMIARALRAGHSFASALGMVGQEIKEPMGPE